MKKKLVNWKEKWQSDYHIAEKRLFFTILDNYLKLSPKNILDIGCGFARESELFQKKYNSELFLLDGDFEPDVNKRREFKYGSADNFRFYNKISDLKKDYLERNMSFVFIDANNISIDPKVKFDLIYSIKSCGFHYPIDTYYNLIKNHIHNNTYLIFDLRQGNIETQLSKFTIENVLYEDEYRITAELKLK